MIVENVRIRSLMAWMFLAMGMVVYGATIKTLDTIPRPRERDLINVAIPAPIQVLLAGGDRYLAANLAVIRSLIVNTGDLDSL
jgi:hypothetical protein